jgi:hypothetical protein
MFPTPDSNLQKRFQNAYDVAKIDTYRKNVLIEKMFFSKKCSRASPGERKSKKDVTGCNTPGKKIF